MTDVDSQAEGDFMEASDRFLKITPAGDMFFFVRGWPAWMLKTEEKKVLPIERVIIGDRNGTVIFERSIMLTGIIDLIDELAEIVSTNTNRLKNLDDYVVDLPVSRAVLLSRIEGVEKSLSKVRQDLSTLSFDEPETEPESESEPTDGAS